MEKRDLYDINRNLTGETIYKGSSIPLNKYILVVLAFIQNSKGDFLIQKRSIQKSGKYASTGGHAKSGETSIEGIRRELKEELGLDIKNNELIFVTTLKRKNIFRDCYVLLKDISIEQITFNDDEVINCKYVTLNEFKNIIKNGESTFTDFSQTNLNYINIDKLRKESNYGG